MLFHVNRLMLVAVFALGGAFARPVLGAEETAFAVYSAGIDGMLNDDLDRGLHAALVAMERNGFQMPMLDNDGDQAAISLLGQILMSRMHLELKMNPADAQAGEFPGSLQLSVFGNSGASVTEMSNRIKGLMERSRDLSERPVPDHQGLMQIQPNVGLQMPPMYWGEAKVGGEEAITISFNGMPSETGMDLSMFGLPSGVMTLAGLRLNFAAMSPVIAPVMMSGGPEGQQGMKVLEEFGILGPDAMDITIGYGVDSTNGHLAGRVTNMLKHWGMLMPEKGMSDSNLRVIPQDATAFSVRRMSMGRLPEFMNAMVDKVMPPDQMPKGPDGKAMEPMDMAVQMTQPVIGIDIVTEFFEYLGETIVIYRSNGTGGGGLFSLTGLIELSNPDGMKATLSTLASRLNSGLSQMSDGYVQLVDWSDEDELDMLTVAFPGIPVPVQVTLGVAGNQMILGMTPDTVRVAASQLRSSSSILNNSTFTTARGRASSKVFEMSYLDTAARMPEAYGFVAGLMTAINNFTMPTGTRIREIRSIMPAYGDLQQAAQPTLMMAMMDQDDMVIKGTGARSMMVHVTSMVGELMSSPMLLTAGVGGMVGLLLPAISQARNAAEMTHAMAEVRDIAVAVHIWSADHDGKLPNSMEQLVQGGYLEADRIMGHMDYYGMGLDMAAVKHPSTTIMAAKWLPENVAVVFMDGHVERMSYQEYEAHLNIQMPHGE